MATRQARRHQNGRRAPRLCRYRLRLQTYLDGKKISPDELSAALTKVLVGAPSGQRNVFLKVHKEAQASHFEPVIAAISQAGGDLVHILEPEEISPKR